MHWQRIQTISKTEKGTRVNLLERLFHVFLALYGRRKRRGVVFAYDTRNLICSSSEVSDLIYWNENDLTPDEVVEQTLNYKPIQL